MTTRLLRAHAPWARDEPTEKQPKHANALTKRKERENIMKTVATSSELQTRAQPH